MSYPLFIRCSFISSFCMLTTKTRRSVVKTTDRRVVVKILPKCVRGQQRRTDQITEVLAQTINNEIKSHILGVPMNKLSN